MLAFVPFVLLGRSYPCVVWRNNYIIEYIALKVNRVLNSIVKLDVMKGVALMDAIERIRSLREDNDKSQTEIAALIHVGQKTYSDYETRKTRIPVESLIILAKYYNIDMNYICGITNEKKSFPKR